MMELSEDIKRAVAEQNFEDVKIKDAFYFPEPGPQYRRLPCPFPGAEEYMAAWEMSGLQVIATVGRYGGMQWLHVSFARRSKMPTYAEMQMVKRDFIGDGRKAIFVLPEKKRYVNINRFCLHLWTCENDTLPDFDCGMGTI